MTKDKCSCCNHDKDLKYCHDCYWKLLFQYLALRENEDLARKIKWEMLDSIQETINPLYEEIEKIKETLKIKTIKKKKQLSSDTKHLNSLNI